MIYESNEYTKTLVSMTRKCHNRTLQTSPRHHEEARQNTDNNNNIIKLKQPVLSLSQHDYYFLLFRLGKLVVSQKLYGYSTCMGKYIDNQSWYLNEEKDTCPLHCKLIASGKLTNFGSKEYVHTVSHFSYSPLF